MLELAGPSVEDPEHGPEQQQAAPAAAATATATATDGHPQQQHHAPGAASIEVDIDTSAPAPFPSNACAANGRPSPGPVIVEEDDAAGGAAAGDDLGWGALAAGAAGAGVVADDQADLKSPGGTWGSSGLSDRNVPLGGNGSDAGGAGDDDEEDGEANSTAAAGPGSTGGLDDDMDEAGGFADVAEEPGQLGAGEAVAGGYERLYETGSGAAAAAARAVARAAAAGNCDGSTDGNDSMPPLAPADDLNMRPATPDVGGNGECTSAAAAPAPPPPAPAPPVAAAGGSPFVQPFDMWAGQHQQQQQQAAAAFEVQQAAAAAEGEGLAAAPYILKVSSDRGDTEFGRWGGGRLLWAWCGGQLILEAVLCTCGLFGSVQLLLLPSWPELLATGSHGPPAANPSLPPPQLLPAAPFHLSTLEAHFLPCPLTPFPSYLLGTIPSPTPPPFPAEMPCASSWIGQLSRESWTKPPVAN